MAGHSLSKTAAFFNAGQIIQVRKTPVIDHIAGLIKDYPVLGWGFFLSSLTLLGLPPSALFVSEFLILLATTQHYPWLAFLLFAGLGIAFAALLQKAQTMVFGEPTASVTTKKMTLSFIPIYFHLMLVFILGVVIPVFLTEWFNQISQLVGSL
jgi:hydrogenase-4 component F